MTIQEKLDSFLLTPGSKEWEQNLDPEFIKKYEQYIDLGNLNTDGTYDNELSQMDAELVELFENLHLVDELEEKINKSQHQEEGTENGIDDDNPETENQTEENIKTEKKKIEKTQNEEILAEKHQEYEEGKKINEGQHQECGIETGIDDNHPEVETQKEGNILTGKEKIGETHKEETQSEKLQESEEPEKHEKKVLEMAEGTFVPSDELLAFLVTAKEVRTSHLRKYNIPREVWKENEHFFIIGNFRLEKQDPADLLLNNWKVIKQE